MNIFEYTDYRLFLNSWSESFAERGGKSRLAEAASCSSSWMTRVLSGSVQLTPDQTMGIALYLNLNDQESEFFLLIVEIERAATPLLKNYIQKKMNKLKKENLKIGTALRNEEQINPEHVLKYYSTWIYSAIHVYCMIKPQATNEIATQLFLNPDVVSKILKIL